MPAAPAAHAPFEAAAASQYEALLEAVTEAATEPEGRRAELALGLFLLEWNYVLGPADYEALLSAPEGSRRLSQIQSDLHGVAWLHVTTRPRPRVERPHAAAVACRPPRLLDLRFWRRRPERARPV